MEIAMKKHSICEQERLIGKAGEVQREDCISALRIRQKVVHQTQHSIQDILSEALELFGAKYTLPLATRKITQMNG